MSSARDVRKKMGNCGTSIITTVKHNIEDYGMPCGSLTRFSSDLHLMSHFLCFGCSKDPLIRKLMAWPAGAVTVRTLERAMTSSDCVLENPFGLRARRAPPRIRSPTQDQGRGQDEEDADRTAVKPKTEENRGQEAVKKCSEFGQLEDRRGGPPSRERVILLTSS
eukprot:gene15399-643_t